MATRHGSQTAAYLLSLCSAEELLHRRRQIDRELAEREHSSRYPGRGVTSAQLDIIARTRLRAELGA
jgi:hypothetical protein